MRFDPPLVEARFLGRRKRFFADIQFADGRREVAHLANTGRMTGCAVQGRPVLVAPLDTRPGRSLRFRLLLSRPGKAWVAVDTALANRVVGEALREGAVPGLEAYDRIRPEARLPGRLLSRFDFLLESSRPGVSPCLVEVKNVTLREGRTALFPDAVTERGRRHLEELARAARRGFRAVIVPFVARGDCAAFAAAALDPAWSRALLAAHHAGVEVLPLRARISRRSIGVDRRASPLPWLAAAP